MNDRLFLVKALAICFLFFVSTLFLYVFTLPATIKQTEELPFLGDEISYITTVPRGGTLIYFIGRKTIDSNKSLNYWTSKYENSVLPISQSYAVNLNESCYYKYILGRNYYYKVIVYPSNKILDSSRSHKKLIERFLCECN